MADCALGTEQVSPPSSRILIALRVIVSALIETEITTRQSILVSAQIWLMPSSRGSSPPPTTSERTSESAGADTFSDGQTCSKDVWGLQPQGAYVSRQIPVVKRLAFFSLNDGGRDTEGCLLHGDESETGSRVRSYSAPAVRISLFRTEPKLFWLWRFVEKRVEVEGSRRVKSEPYEPSVGEDVISISDFHVAGPGNDRETCQLVENGETKTRQMQVTRTNPTLPPMGPLPAQTRETKTRRVQAKDADTTFPPTSLASFSQTRRSSSDSSLHSVSDIPSSAGGIVARAALLQTFVETIAEGQRAYGKREPASGKNGQRGKSEQQEGPHELTKSAARHEAASTDPHAARDQAASTDPKSIAPEVSSLIEACHKNLSSEEQYQLAWLLSRANPANARCPSKEIMAQLVQKGRQG